MPARQPLHSQWFRVCKPCPLHGCPGDTVEPVPDYDAFLLVSFGGPEGPDDVVPFLRNVTRGRGVPATRLEVGEGAPVIDKIRPYFNHPGFIEPFADATRTALGSLPPEASGAARLVFTAHSIPVGMAAASGSSAAGTAVAVPGGRYAAQLRE